MKFLIVFLITCSSVVAQPTWSLELKDGTIFSLGETPRRDGESYHFNIGGKTIQVPAKSVTSLTSSKPQLKRYLYKNAKEKHFTAAENRKTVVRVESKVHRGSGTLIHPQGYILTNNHLVSTSHEVEVILHNGKKYSAEITAKSTLFDLAILKITPLKNETFAFARFGDEKKLSSNPEVYTFSTTDKIPWKKNSTSLLSRSEHFGIEDGILYQQYSISMRSDNTGSPLFDKNGHLVGIATQKIESA